MYTLESSRRAYGLGNVLLLPLKKKYDSPSLLSGHSNLFPSLNGRISINYPMPALPLDVGYGRQTTCSLVHRSSSQEERSSRSSIHIIVSKEPHLYLDLGHGVEPDPVMA